MRVTLMLWIIAEISGARRFTINLLNNKNKKYFQKPQKTPRPRVLHGRTAAKDEYPYVVSILTEEKYRTCTGSLIADTWILTAGHCLRPNVKFVKCGNMSIPWENTKCKSRILHQISHPAYVDLAHTAFTDIGLLRTDISYALATGIRGRLHAVDSKTLLGRAVRFAGFGMTYHSNEHNSKSREYLEGEDEMRDLQTGVGVIFDVNEFLLIAPKCDNIRQIGYSGDSGGPLFVDGKISGVLSEGTHFNDGIHPEHSVYTPVSPYLDWIRQTINNKKFQ